MNDIFDDIANDFNNDEFLKKEEEKNRHRKRIDSKKYKNKKNYCKQIKKIGHDN